MADETSTSTNGTGTNTTTTTTAPTTSWTDGLGDELKGFVQNKGFKEPKDVVDSYRNLEKAMGVPKERLLHLPESLEAPEMSQVWERLGAVKEAKEYQFDVPAENLDEKFGEWAKEAFHKLKVPRNMAEGFVKALNERQASQLKADKEAFTLEVKNQQEAIKKEWGGNFEKNQNIADQAAKRFELSKDEVSALGAALGPAKALKFLHKLGEGLGEAKFVDGNKSSGDVMTPEQAQTEIKLLIRDRDFSRRLQAKDVDALNKWNRLHQFAAQGSMTI